MPPKKNISRIIADIRHINKEKRRPVPHGEPITIKTERIHDWAPEEDVSRTTNIQRAWKKRTWLFGLLIFIFSVLVIAYWYGTRVPQTVDDASNNKSIIQEFKDRFLPFLTRGVSTYGDIGSIPTQSFALLEEARMLESKWPELLFQNGGSELLDHLKKIESSLSTLSNALNGIKNIGDLKLPSLLSLGNELSLSLELERWRSLVHELVAWLSVPTPRHIAVLFLNPSEIRPGGGFLGSFAEVTIDHGSIADVTVRDINEVDRTLAIQVVPPKPLQDSERRWRTADTNWFFDFADSAKKTLSFFSSSKLYRDRNITFDGVVAISPQVVSDILARTGSIVVAGSNTPISSSTLLYAIQKSVQNGQAIQADSPKEILGSLVPKLFEHIMSLTEEDRSALLASFVGWVNNREILAYFPNEEFEKNLEYYGAAGRVYSLPANFEGDYLAVVNTNVDGGKTDLFMRNRVALDAQVNLDGTVTHHLIVQRMHAGYESSYWWYRVDNQNYARIFTPPGSTLTGASGALNKRITPKVNFASGDYENDADLERIESTARTYLGFPAVTSFVESGKTVFAAWTRTSLRTTSTLTFDYQHRLFAVPADGKSYTFVLERQMGDESAYHIILNAPIGYVWAENNLPIYEYADASPPGRKEIVLTFRKI